MTAPSLPPAFLEIPLAHRGLHGPGVPENSRAAVEAAAAAGYGIEIDLQLSADGVPMVFHDASLDRMTGARGPVRSRDAAELGRIGLKGGDEGIPTFAEVVALVAGRVPLLVELKDQTGTFGPSDGAFERAVAAAAEGYAGDLAFMSYSPALAAGMAQAAPARPRGLVTEAYRPAHWPGLPRDKRRELAKMEAVEEIGAAFVSHGWRALHMPRIAELKARGLPVLSWTVRSAREEAKARRHADNITFEGYLPACAP